MNYIQTLNYLNKRKRTAAYEALIICRKFYPWRCLPDRTQLTSTIFGAGGPQVVENRVQ